MADQTAIIQELASRRDSMTPQQQSIVDELQSRIRPSAQPAMRSAEPQSVVSNSMVDANGQEATTPARLGGPPDVLKPAIIPTALQVGGGIVGGRLGGVRGAMLGESGGGALGALINQHLGITEPSMSEPIVNAVVPPAIRGTVGAIRAGKAMYGQTGAANINRLLPDEAASRVSDYMPQTPASHLFQQASQQGTLVPMAPASQSLTDTLGFINGLSSGTKRQYREAMTIAKGLQDKIAAQGDHLTPIDLQNELAGLNRSITKLQRSGAPGVDKLVGIKEGLLDSLDQAAQAGTPGAATLQSARHTYMRQESVKELQDYINKAISLKRGVGSDTQFNPNQVLNNLKKDRFFTKAFSPSEQEEIVGMLEMMNKAPVIGPGAGQTYGSGKVLSQVAAAGGLGAAAHYTTGNPDLAASIAVTAAVAPHIHDVSRNLVLAMQTSGGRKVLKDLLTNSKGAITPQVITALGEAMGASRARQPQSVVPPTYPRTSMNPTQVIP